MGKESSVYEFRRTGNATLRLFFKIPTACSIVFLQRYVVLVNQFYCIQTMTEISYEKCFVYNHFEGTVTPKRGVN